MKKQTFLAIAALLVFGLGAATFAYRQINTSNTTAVSCCCCEGDSCPMKTKGEKPQTVSVAAVSGSDEGCCCPCCDAKKDGQTS